MPWRAALREAHEEIGLSESFVEFAGYLPDHWVGTGFRVTPGGRLRQSRVRAAHRGGRGARCVRGAAATSSWTPPTTSRASCSSADLTIEVYDIPYGERIIWGATAGMLMTFRRLLQARQAALTGGAPDEARPS